MIVRFKADRPDMQNLTLSYAPNPVSTGSMKQGDSADELLYDARLDNNGMHYALRIKAINKGGRLDNDGNRIKGDICRRSGVHHYSRHRLQDELRPPTSTTQKTYVGTDPLATTKKWLDDAAGKTFRLPP